MNLVFDRSKLADALVSIALRRLNDNLFHDINDLRLAFGLDDRRPPDTKEGQVRDLLINASTTAIARSLRELPGGGHADLAASARAVAAVEIPEELPLTPGFFERGEYVGFLDALMPLFTKTLVACNVPASDHDAHWQTLRREFDVAIDGEFRNKSDRYALLEDYLGPTPVDRSALRHRNWARYRNSLIAQVQQPLLNLDLDHESVVSLEQVFVPLRCRFDRQVVRPHGRPITQRVFSWLDERVQFWLDDGTADDPFRFISGEMGSGKSSYARMLAAQLARDGKNIVIVPLHQLGTIEGGWQQVLADFLGHKDRLGHNPVANEALDDYGLGEARSPLLLILDGLDELTMIDGGSAQLAKAFVTDLANAVQQKNNGRLRMRALFIGRPLAVGEITGYGSPGQQLHVLRFRHNPDELSFETVYEGDKERLVADQAPDWWVKFQRATGKPAIGVPQAFTKDATTEKALSDILAQPLLNYLVAIVPEGEKARSVNELYRNVFKDLYDRETGTGIYVGKPPKSPALASLESEHQFLEILQYIALAAWHYGDRQVTSEQIKVCFRRLGRLDLLNQASSIGSDLSVIFNSFFVEKVGRGLKGAFDFTHKGFREYLTANALKEMVLDINEKVNASPRRRRQYTIDDAVDEWQSATSPTRWDSDLQSFFIGEWRYWLTDPQNYSEPNRRPELVSAKDTLCLILDHILQYGLPVPVGHARLAESPSDSVTSLEFLDQSANVEAALLASLGGIYTALRPDNDEKLTDTADHICKVPTLYDDLGLYRLLSRLRARFGHQEDMLIWYAVAVLDGAQINASARFGEGSLRYRRVSLGNLDLHGWHLAHVHLVGANLVGVNLRDSNLEDAHLKGADLERANLVGANLQGANLEGAHLEGADLAGADLAGAKLANTHLLGAKLACAHLEDANLKRANLRGADLAGADLERADLAGADLASAKLAATRFLGADLADADLEDANLERANLQEAHLEGANLEGADLLGANFRDADLARANLKQVDLRDAKLVDAKLVGADLEGANLERADLEGAKLVDTNLENAHLEGADLLGADLLGANFRDADLARANLKRVDLQDAKLVDANLESADLRGANLMHANLKDAKLVDANLEGADLRDASLEGANLVRANLEDADLVGADLERANLEDADLTNAIVDPIRPAGIKLAGAIGIPKAWQEDPTD